MLSIFWLLRRMHFAEMYRIENELWNLRNGFSLLSKMLILHELCFGFEDSRRNINPNSIATCSLENFVVNMSTYPRVYSTYTEGRAQPGQTLHCDPYWTRVTPSRNLRLIQEFWKFEKKKNLKRVIIHTFNFPIYKKY